MHTLLALVIILYPVFVIQKEHPQPFFTYIKIPTHPPGVSKTTIASTADENCAALEVQKQLQDAMDYKGSAEEKRVRLFLANLGIDYDALTMEQFANLIEVLKLSKHMNSPISQRGKGSMTHGKGK